MGRILEFGMKRGFLIFPKTHFTVTRKRRERERERGLHHRRWSLTAEVEKDMKRCCTVRVETDTNRRRTRSLKPCRVLELPVHVIFDILSRLTVETIFSCKCVCKTFLEILTDPYFVELHLTKAPKVDEGLVIQNVFRVSEMLVIYSNKLDDYNSRPCQTLDMPAVISHCYIGLVTLIGSCNGIILLSHRDSFSNPMDTYFLCNPILGESWALPLNHKHPIPYAGFGFYPKTKQYKVIRFNDSRVCTIYTLGTSSWREISKLPFPRSMRSIGDCSLNGYLYWITESRMISDLVCSFNLETEQFSYIYPPAHFDHDAVRVAQHVQIGLLDGLLCFSYVLGVRYEAFVMKDLGLKGCCWTKELTLDIGTISVLRGSSYLMFRLVNNGDLFIKYDDGKKLIVSNLRKGTIRHILPEEVIFFTFVSFVPSFVSLKDMAAAAGGLVDIVQRKTGRNLWSGNGFRLIH